MRFWGTPTGLEELSENKMVQRLEKVKANNKDDAKVKDGIVIYGEAATSGSKNEHCPMQAQDSLVMEV